MSFALQAAFEQDICIITNRKRALQKEPCKRSLAKGTLQKEHCFIKANKTSSVYFELKQLFWTCLQGYNVF